MINKEVKEKALELGICEEWASRISNADESELANMFFSGSDWAFKHDFPTVELLSKNNEIKKHGLYLNENGRFESIERLAFFGNSDVEVVYNNFEVAELYVRHNTKSKVVAINYAILTIFIEDNAEVIISKDSTSKVTVKRYNGMVEGECNLRECKWEK